MTLMCPFQPRIFYDAVDFPGGSCCEGASLYLSAAFPFASWAVLASQKTHCSCHHLKLPSISTAPEVKRAPQPHSPSLIVQLPNSSRCHFGAPQPLTQRWQLPVAPLRGAEGVKRGAAGAAGLASAGHRRRCGGGRVWASMATAGGEGAPRAEGMVAVNEEEDGEENILYDLLVNAEWPPETELQVSGGVAGLRSGGREGSRAATSAARREAGGVRRLAVLGVGSAAWGAAGSEPRAWGGKRQQKG